MMGEGIAYAMKSAKYAVHIILDAISQGRHDEDFLSTYQMLCNSDFEEHFAMAGFAGQTMNSFGEFILTKASGHRFAGEIMAMIARGEIKYSQVPYTFLTKLPKELPAIIQHVVQSRIAHYT
jgi:flavin-dependent dehydrogenase